MTAPTTDTSEPRLRMAICHRLLPFATKPMLPLGDYFSELGWDAVYIKDDPAELVGRDALFMWGNVLWYPHLKRYLCVQKNAELPLVVVWHSEPLPAPRRAGLRWPLPTITELRRILRGSANDIYSNYLTLRRLSKKGLPHVLAVGARGRQEFLLEHGIHAHFVPLGYSDDAGRDLQRERDIDVLFIGGPNESRTQRMLSKLRAAGIDVQVVGSWSSPATWGESRTLLLNRAKILVNFAKTQGEFSDHRLILGMANKTLVVSEPIFDSSPFMPGRHFVMVPVEKIADTIRFYLSHSEERNAITEAAYRLVTTEVTLRRSVQSLVGLIENAWERRRASIGEQSIETHPVDSIS